MLKREACLQALERDPAFALQWLAVLSQRQRQAETSIAEPLDRRRIPSAPPARGPDGEESARLLDAGSAVLVLGDQDPMFRFRLVVKPV